MKSLLLLASIFSATPGWGQMLWSFGSNSGGSGVAGTISVNATQFNGNGSASAPLSLVPSTGVVYDAAQQALLVGTGQNLSLSSGIFQASWSYNGGSETTFLRMGYGYNQLASSDFDLSGVTNDLYGVATGGRIGFGPIMTMHGISINAVGQEAVFKMYASSGTSYTNGTTKLNQCALYAFGEQVSGVDKGHTAALGMCANQDATASALGTYMAFQVTANGATAPSSRMILYNTGQLGVNATPVASTVTVGGVIESMSGGFKFPDGTTQTTASNGASVTGLVVSGSSWTIGTSIGISTVGVGAAVQYNFGNCQNTSAYYTAAFGQAGCSASPNAANGNAGDRSLIPLRFYNTTTVSIVGMDSGDATEVGMGAEAGGAWLGSAKSNTVQFRVNGAEKGRFDTLGGLGINLGANASALLHVKSTATQTGSDVLRIDSSSGGKLLTVNVSSGIGVASGTVVYSNLGPFAISTGSPSGAGGATSANPNFFMDTNGRVVFTPNLISTFTTGAIVGSTTSATLGGCFAGSTVTFNVLQGNNAVDLWVHGSASVNSLGARVFYGVVVDGLLVDGETASKGLGSFTEQVSADNNNVGWKTTISGLTTGNHSACLTMATTGGTATIDSTDSNLHLHGKTSP